MLQETHSTSGIEHDTLSTEIERLQEIHEELRRRKFTILCGIMSILCGPLGVASLLIGGLGLLSDGKIVPELISMGIVFLVIPVSTLLAIATKCKRHQAVALQEVTPGPCEVIPHEIELSSVQSHPVVVNT